MNEPLPAAAEAPIPSPRPAPVTPPSRWAQIWRVLSHPWLLWSLLILGIILWGAYTWLPQAPTPLAHDATGRAAWLQETAQQTPAGMLLWRLGLLDVAHNGISRMLLPLLAALLLIHLINGAMAAWAARHLQPPAVWLPGLRAWDVTLPSGWTPEAGQKACQKRCHHPRIQMAATTAQPWLCDCHHRWTWGALLLDIGLLLALLALLLNLNSGWQLDDLTLDPGQSRSLAPYAEQRITLTEGGAQLTLCCPQQASNIPPGVIRYRGIQVRVTDQRPAVRISLQRQDKPLTLQAIEQGASASPELVVHFPEIRSERTIAAPEAGLLFRLVAQENGSIQIQALDAENQLLLSQNITGAATLPVGPDMMLAATPTTSAIVRAQGRPWTWLIWPALLLMALGLAIHWRYPYWRVGVRTNEAGAAVRWQGAASTYKQLSAWINAALVPDEATENHD